MKYLWKKWIFIAQFYFQDPDSEYGFGSSMAIWIRIQPVPDPKHCRKVDVPLVAGANVAADQGPGPGLRLQHVSRCQQGETYQPISNWLSGRVPARHPIPANETQIDKSLKLFMSWK